MKTKQIVFTKPNVAELLDVTYAAPRADEVTVSLEYSAISAGTEKANLMGMRNGTGISENDEPRRPCHCVLGKAPEEYNCFQKKCDENSRQHTLGGSLFGFDRHLPVRGNPKNEA